MPEALSGAIGDTYASGEYRVHLAAAVAEQSRPVRGLRLGLAALWRALVRLFRRPSR